MVGILQSGRSDRKVILVVYDPSTQACQKALETIQLRESTLPMRPTVELISWPSSGALEVLRSADAKLREMNLGDAFEMRGQMVALLPSGLVLANCQADVMQLIAEMEYMAMVQPPLPQVTIQIERHLGPLRALRLAAGEAPGVWWRKAETISRVADALDDICFCVIDDFLPLELMHQLARGIESSRPQGHIPAEGKNGWTRGGTARAAEAIHSEGDFEKRNERLARSLMNPSRGDVLKFADGDDAMPGTSRLCSAVDDLVMGLKRCPQVASRLENTDFANAAMFTVYPGNAARYIKHTDNSLITDGRRLTAILYLNQGWEPSHGGQLRIFEPTMQSMRTKMDVDPIWNRLLIFWATEDVPHEVLPSYRDRAAVSLWYACAKECLQTEEAFKRLVSKIRCVGDQSREERLMAAGEGEEQMRLLGVLGRSLALLSRREALNSAAALDERQGVLAAVEHDFAGCEAHRRQRARLNTLFGWDARAASVQRQIMESQLQQLGMFEALGLAPPPGVKAMASVEDVAAGQTSAPAFTEEFCRRTDRERRERRERSAISVAPAEAPVATRAALPSPVAPAPMSTKPAPEFSLAQSTDDLATAMRRVMPGSSILGVPRPTHFEVVD